MIASDRVAVPVEQGAHDRRPWAGIVCTVVAALFLAFDAGLKLLRAGPAVEGTTSLGYPADSVAWIGGIELGVSRGVYGAANGTARSVVDDRVPRRRGRHSRACLEPAPDSHVLPGLRGPAPLGGPVLA